MGTRRRQPGTSLGVAGGGLSGPDTSWARADSRGLDLAAKAERDSAGRLDALATRQGFTVLNDLHVPIPGNNANIDHIVVAGRTVLVLDTKCWKPGVYWSLAGRTRRGWVRVAHVDKNNSRMELDSLRRYLTEHLGAGSFDLVNRVTILVWPSGRKGKLRLINPATPASHVTHAEKALARLGGRRWRKNADPAIVAALTRLLSTSPVQDRPSPHSTTRPDPARQAAPEPIVPPDLPGGV